MKRPLVPTALEPPASSLPSEPPPPNSEPEGTGLASGKETVLVVDDTATNVIIVTAFLTKTGYEVLVAENGEQALEVATQAKPDLILLDVMMPKLDGYETCQRLKAQAATQDIPILFMTSRTGTKDKVQGFHVGAVDYITRPYQSDELLSRIRTHLTLARQRRELTAMLAERSRFMKIAAHDLRNPLSAILGWASHGRESAQSAELRTIFGDMEKAARQMRSIIDEFLSLQVVRGGGQANADARFDLARLMAQVMAEQTGAAERKRIALVFEPPAPPPMVRGNPTHTAQILTNYLSNAVKYSPPGSRVAIFMFCKEKACRVEVRDQGPGVVESERPELFVEFGQISNKPTGGEQRTGLGLAIVKRLAEAQGGKVGADFPASGGSVFWVELPI
jgi:two-component system, sensor histidine kinase and response regulator